MGAPFHPLELKRLETLRSYKILDTRRDTRFDRFVFMAAQIARTPIAAIRFVDEARVWNKAGVGTPEQEASRDVSFCPYTILTQEITIVEDLSEDPRFAQNPYVTGRPFVRFYAGVPLLAHDGLPLGTICVMGLQPRSLAKEQQTSLITLARELEELLHTFFNG